MRRKLAAGNWKMNGTQDALSQISALSQAAQGAAQVVICPPATLIAPAAQALPGWLGDMPTQTEAETLGGASVRTLKHCPPVIDAMRLGVLIPNI